MNGEYVELAGADSETGVLHTLTELLQPLVVEPGEQGLVLLELDNLCFAYVDWAPSEPWTAVLAIGHPEDDDQVRRSTAESVYRKLAAHTPWSLRWTSDCTPTVISTATLDRTTAS